jgi:hypothetical protein
LDPLFVPGLVLRYRFESHTTTVQQVSGLVTDAQGAQRIEFRFAAVVRIEPSAPLPSGQLPMQATFEKVEVTAGGDTFDPRVQDAEEEYRKLAGLGVVLFADAQGNVHTAPGLHSFDPSTIRTVEDMIQQTLVGAAAPRAGIVPGQAWSSTKPVQAAPLAGLTLRRDFAYLRDEPCAAAFPGEPSPLPSDELCAVIQTRNTISRPARGDPTPEDYRKRGLRTSGRWTASGEARNFLSRRSGWVVSSSFTGDDDVDLAVLSTETSNRVRRTARTHTEASVRLLEQAEVRK